MLYQHVSKCTWVNAIYLILYDIQPKNARISSYLVILNDTFFFSSASYAGFKNVKLIQSYLDGPNIAGTTV